MWTPPPLQPGLTPTSTWPASSSPPVNHPPPPPTPPTPQRLFSSTPKSPSTATPAPVMSPIRQGYTCRPCEIRHDIHDFQGF